VSRDLPEPERMQGGHSVVGGGVVHRVLMPPRATRVGPHPTREKSGAVEDDDVEVEVRSTSSASSTTVVAVTVLIGGWSESHPPALRREPLDGEVRVTDVNHCFRPSASAFSVTNAASSPKPTRCETVW
jgi:hypothetical protein